MHYMYSSVQMFTDRLGLLNLHFTGSYFGCVILSATNCSYCKHCVSGVRTREV